MFIKIAFALYYTNYQIFNVVFHFIMFFLLLFHNNKTQMLVYYLQAHKNITYKLY